MLKLIQGPPAACQCKVLGSCEVVQRSEEEEGEEEEKEKDQEQEEEEE